jgi:hypothetical protein
MPKAPRMLIDFVARHRTHRLREQLRKQGDGTAAQRTLLRQWLARAAATEFGRQHGLSATLTPEQFRTRVPLRRSAEFRPWIERMAAGNTDVLWPGRCRLFVYTAGTVDGTQTFLPATTDLLLHFRRGIAAALFLHVARAGEPTLFHGSHLHAGASTEPTEGNGAYAGYLDAIVSLALTEWSAKNLYAPTAEIARLPEGPEKIATLAENHAASDIRLLAGTPATLVALGEAIRSRRPFDQAAADLRREWPQLECLLTYGAMPDLFAAELDALAGPHVARHEAYLAAEGFFAAQDGKPGDGLRLLTNLGVYFEFLPLSEFDTSSSTPLGSRCVPLEGVRAGEDYALVVTTPGGLCRCLIGDAVRFVSTHPPRLLFLGRTEHLLNTFGEHVTERDLTASLLEVCQRNHWHAVNFHVAPYLERAVPRPQGSHEWWVELRPGTVRTPTGLLLADELDAKLGRRHRGYATRRASGALMPPLVRLVIPGTFAQWSELQPSFGGLGKFARCRGDRLIADQLAGIARFHAGTHAPFVPVSPARRSPAG